MPVSHSPAKSADLVSRLPRAVALNAARVWIVALVFACLLGVLAPGRLHAQSITLTNGPVVNFGQVSLNTTTSQNVNLNFNTTLTISNVQVGGDYSVYEYSCNLSQPITAGTNCTWEIQFTPTKPGQRWTPLVLTDSSGNNYSFGLEGTGLGSAVAFTPGIMSTVAGNGSPGYSGDGGAATSAEFNYPFGIALDGAGNIYIADWNNASVRVVNMQAKPITVAGVNVAAGDIATVAGNGTAGWNGDNIQAIKAELDEPFDVAVDSAGNVYIADSMNERIRKVDVNGTITTVAGGALVGGTVQGFSGDGGAATDAQLSNPLGVAVDSAGNLYIADANNNRVRKVDTEGIISTIAGSATQGYTGDGGPATSATLACPDGVAADSTGNFYIVDFCNNVVRAVNTQATPITMAGVTIGLGDIATVAGTGTANATYSGDGGPATSAGVNYPLYVALDSAGNLYIGDYKNSCVRKVDPSGIITTVAGNGTAGYSGDGGAATSARLDYASGIAVDDVGNLYITDEFSQRIRKVNVGTSTLAFGSVNIGQTSSTQSVAVSDVGNASLNLNGIAYAGSSFPSETVTNKCAGTASVGIGQTCKLGVAFAPTAAGNAGGTITLTDDAFNRPQVVNLSGTGIVLTTAFSGLTPSQTATFGSSITLSGTISAPGPAYPPSGERVTVTVGTFSQSTAIGSNGFFSLSFTVSLPAGNYPIAYTYPGDGSFTSASDTSTTLTVTPSGTVSYTLALTEVGTGAGTVTDNSSLINCSEANGSLQTGHCSQQYGAGSVVTLTATATSPSTFAGWGGPCVSSGMSPTCTLAMTSAQNVTASFAPPPASFNLTFGTGTNVTEMATFGTGSNAHALTLNIPVVSTSFPVTVTATEFLGDGLCPPGGNGQSTDPDCRFVSFFNYGNAAQDGSGSTVVPLCYPYANGNCVHYLVYYGTQGNEPPDSYYSGGVNWKIGFNNASFIPGSYWTGSTPRMLDDPDADEFTPRLPYGTDCSKPMEIGTPGQEYLPPTYCQFDADITTYYDPTPGLDPIGGKSPKLNDVVVAFLPTSTGSNSIQQPPSQTPPTIAGSCVTGCVSSGSSITFAEGTPGIFAVTSQGYPTPKLTESGSLPSGLTFNAITGMISGTPVNATSSNITLTAHNGVSPDATQTYTLAVSGLRISPTSVNFGTLYLGQIGSQLVTLTNTGTTPITISSVTITAPGNALADYGDITLCPPLTITLPATLAAGKSCAIAVGTLAWLKIFSPTASTATLTITDSVAGSPQSVPLTAQVINPQAKLSTNRLTFPAQKVGTTSAVKSITVTNTGNTPLNIGTVTISGNFAQASGTTCTTGGAVAAGANCVINVTFTPTAMGSRSGSVKITDNALCSPQTISLSGTGD